VEDVGNMLLQHPSDQACWGAGNGAQMQQLRIVDHCTVLQSKHMRKMQQLGIVDPSHGALMQTYANVAHCEQCSNATIGNR
jgi:hypothetical protein